MKAFLQRSTSLCQQNVKQKKPLSFLKTLPLLVGVVFFGAGAKAQNYHTYHNADSANPILNATPKPQNIIGMQFFDVDGDKDLDCYMTTSGSDKPLLYKNVGTLKRPEYQLSSSNGFEDVTLVQSNTKRFGFFDFDNDGDMDFFYEGYHIGIPATNNYSFIKTYTNDGTKTKPHFVDASTFFSLPYATSLNGYYYFTFQDVDGDGDLDYAFSANTPGNGYSYTTDIYLNTSTSGLATLTRSFYGTEILQANHAFYDFSGDGLPDCMLSYGTNGTQFFQNIGSPDTPYVNIYRYGPPPYPPTPDFGNIDVRTIVDLNNDGQPEVFNTLGNYATVVPVPVLKATITHSGGKTITKLSATTQLPGYKYQWEYNGKKKAGATKPTINASTPGKYVLYIKDSLGIGVSLPYITPSQKSSSTSELIVTAKPALQAVTAQVYPNPFVQSVTLTFSGGSSSVTKIIRVTDMSGRRWLTQTTSATSLQIGATLPKGMYQLEIWQNNALTYHTKILKQ